MRKAWHLSIAAALVGLLSFVNPAPLRAADDDTKETDRVRNAGKVAKEIMDIPDDIPQDLINKADCVIVLPSVLKAAFIVGASYGRGVMTCRTGDSFRGPWSAPSMMALEGGSFGFQIGGQVTEFIIILNTRAAVTAFARGGNVELGGALSVVAGPLGRVAEAGVLPLAAVYTYSRSQGFFAGASLEGTIFIAQSGKNAKYYQQPVTPEEILSGRAVPPPGARALIAALDQY